MKSLPDSNHWRQLFDHLEDVLAWLKDRSGRYVWVNRAFLVNYALEHPTEAGPAEVARVIGKTDYDLSPAFLADQYRIDDEQVLAGKRISNRIELVGESKEGATWHVTHKIPVFDARGAIVGTAGITRMQSTGELNPKGSDFGAVLAFMRENYRHAITNEQLAATARMSLRAFERRFLASFHLTPQRYLRRLRLGIASRALIGASQSLVEIALACGFGDQSHFTREFRRHFGRTPREYRAHYQQPEAQVH
jgi:AraC-like DNA-binding protein